MYPDTREIKVHFFCHQMTSSRGSKSTPIYDDMLPLSKRILSPVDCGRATNQVHRPKVEMETEFSTEVYKVNRQDKADTAPGQGGNSIETYTRPT